MSKISSTAIEIIIYTKVINKPLNTVFFIFSIEQFFEMFPKHNEHALILVSFDLNLITSVPLTNK